MKHRNNHFIMRNTLIIPALWIVSFLLSLYFVPSFTTISMGLSIIILYVWAFYAFARKSKEWQIPSSYIFYGLMMFWGLACISIIHSEVFYVSFMAFCFFSVLPLSIIAFAQINNTNFYRAIGKEVIILLALLGLWAAIQVLFFTDYFGVRALNPLRNPNSLAALLNFGVVGAFGWLVMAKDHPHKILAILGLTCCFLGVIFTGGRGALFAVLPILIIFGGLFWRDIKDKALYIIAASVFLTAVFFIYQSEFMNDAMIKRMARFSSVDMNVFLSNRIQLWQATIEMIKVHGLFGTGIGTYFLYFPEFRLPTDIRGAYYAHNDPLQFWVEMGVLAPILFYAIGVGLTVKTFKTFKKAQNKAEKLALLIPFFALSVMVIHTHVTFNFSNLSILLVSGFAFGAWFNAVQRIDPYKMYVLKAEKTHKTRVVIVALILSAFGIGMWSFLLSEANANKAKTALFDGNLPVFADHVLKAKDLSFDLNHRANLLAATMPITMLEKKQYEDEVVQRDVYNQTIEYLEQAIAANPRSASPYFYKGYIQRLVPEDFFDTQMDTPENYYKTALRLDPLHLGARMALGDYYAAQNDKAKELEILEAGAQYIYNTQNALLFYFRLRALYAQLGDAEKDEALRIQMQRLQKRLDIARAKENQSLFE